MKCKNCGEEMVLGYIKCRDGICWCEKPSPVTAIPSLGKNSIPLGNNEGNLLSAGTVVEAYRCEKCRDITIHY